MSQNFKKTTENFICQNCGMRVIGNGYTNHCPKCLYSKHVDNSPGDRGALCSGLMRPVGAEESGGEWSIIQKCQKCGIIKKNKLSTTDNFDKIVKISSK